MPRNLGTSRKGKPKKEMRAAGFGNALQRAQVKRFVPKANGSSAHGQGMLSTGAQSIGIEEPSEGAKMKSVLEMDDLSDFLLQAQLANKDYQTEREQFLNIDTVAQEFVPHRQQKVTFYDEHESHSRTNASLEKFAFHELSVPRRPPWTPGVTTAEELEVLENEYFLEWRRNIAKKEEEIAALAFSSNRGGISGASVTPYEKNLHVWRQLWRVLERSAIILQIVDARNPLFYFSEDLRRYTMDELGKPMLMIINKSDYLTARQRKVWSEYFTRKGVDHLFFSAHDEQRKIDHAAAIAKRSENFLLEQNFVSDNDSEIECDQIDAVNGETRLHSEKSAPSLEFQNDQMSDYDDIGVTSPLTREQFLITIAAFAASHRCTPDKKYGYRIQYGMVGFPNVGKSSVINVLVGSSKNIHGVVRVGVAAQPGKTKHFQTLLLPDRSDMMLCDCPGLVFPSFVSSTADLIAAGVFPIAQMRDHWPVVSLICKRVPRGILNAHYGIQIPEPSEHDLREKGLYGKPLPTPSAEELLGTYCIARSVIAPASGIPDYQRASRVIVKDYSEGKLLYCHPPPQLDDAHLFMTDTEFLDETISTAIRNTNNVKKLKKLQLLEESLAASKVQEVTDGSNDSDFDVLFRDMNEPLDGVEKEQKHGNAHKTIKKWGKKGRKLRNKDPYGCHLNPDSVLSNVPASAGVIINAGRYTTSGYTRLNYAGARAASLLERSSNRPIKDCR